MTAKMKFGVHAAKAGENPALMAKVELIVSSMIYMKLRISPIPRYNPIPPLRLRDDSDSPIIVRMNDENDTAIRLWYSISYCTTLPEPRDVCSSPYKIVADCEFPAYLVCILLRLTIDERFDAE